MDAVAKDARRNKRRNKTLKGSDASRKTFPQDKHRDVQCALSAPRIFKRGFGKQSLDVYKVPSSSRATEDLVRCPGNTPPLVSW